MRWHSIRWGFKITFDARDSEPTWAKMLRFPPHLHPVAPTRWKQPETNDIEVQPVQLQPTWYLLDKSGDHDLREWKEWWSPPFQGAKGSCHEVCQPGSARQRAITMKVQHQDIFCAMSLGMFGTRLSFCDVRDWLCCTPAKILLRLRSTCSIPGYHSGLPEAFRVWCLDEIWLLTGPRPLIHVTWSNRNSGFSVIPVTPVVPSCWLNPPLPLSKHQ